MASFSLVDVSLSKCREERPESLSLLYWRSGKLGPGASRKGSFDVKGLNIEWKDLGKNPAKRNDLISLSLLIY